jgi:integrase
MPARRFLTDRFLRSLPPAKRRHIDDIWDTSIPGFGVRVYDAKDSDPTRRGKAGKINFMLYARFGAGAFPARVIVGGYPAISLEEARRKAGTWRSLIDRGVDPRDVEQAEAEKAAREAALRIQHSVASVAEDFIADKLAKERSGKVAERDLRNTFVAAWGERLITEITEDDVLAIVNTKKRRAPEQARALLILVKRFFAWVIDQRSYGLTASPCDRLFATKIIGELQSRTRHLNDAEIAAFWRASGKMPYPVGAVYRTLLLTGLRLNEAAAISWSEIHGNSIIIPAARMKGREGKARDHLVPLTQAMQEIIASVPRYRGGPYLFSYKAGKSPVTMTGPMKRDLDGRMLRTLKAMARRRGEDHHNVELPDWVNHDLRRTVRTGLSKLKIPRDVAEAVLAHRPPGIIGTYNLHEFEDEKREALAAWEQHIASVVNPPKPAKVVRLAGRRR